MASLWVKLYDINKWLCICIPRWTNVERVKAYNYPVTYACNTNVYVPISLSLSLCLLDICEYPGAIVIFRPTPTRNVNWEPPHEKSCRCDYIPLCIPRLFQIPRLLFRPRHFWIFRNIQMCQLDACRTSSTDNRIRALKQRALLTRLHRKMTTFYANFHLFAEFQ